MDQTEVHTRIGASAAAIITDAAGQALIVKPTDKARWNLPGGRINDGELPRQAAAREIREELGLDLPVGDLLVHAWVHTAGTGSHAYYVFQTSSLTQEQQDSIRLQESELADSRFVEPADIDPQIIPTYALAAWKAALVARAEGQVQYVEVDM